MNATELIINGVHFEHVDSVRVFGDSLTVWMVADGPDVLPPRHPEIAAGLAVVGLLLMLLVALWIRQTWRRGNGLDW